MKTLYLECANGISGDMFIGSLLSLGGSEEKLRKAIESLSLSLQCEIQKKSSYSISGIDFSLLINGHAADYTESREEGYCEHKENPHAHAPFHEHRHLKEILEWIDKVDVTENARRLAIRIFEIIAEAEAHVHGVSKEAVHFHEVGALDSIGDIISAAVLIDDLDIQELIVPALTEGTGFVKTQHGTLPVPVPAVVKIAEQFGLSLRQIPVQGEMLTPTGIAIVAALRETLSFKEALPHHYKIVKTGIGLGKRDFGRANFLRAQIIESVHSSGDSPHDKNVYLLETNLDDTSGEDLGFAMEKILEAGARDIQFIPCFMKKNRPGILLRIIADKERLSEVEASVFKHTTTAGLCRIPVERNCMHRDFFEVKTEFGMVRIKKSSTGEVAKFKPEFDDLKTLAARSGKSISEIRAKVAQKLSEFSM